jgi:Uma2 family endonuclease
MTTEITQCRKLTYEDYAQIPEDGYQHEIIDGEHYVNPAPSTYHQAVSRRLQFLLYVEIEQTHQGVVINAPYDVQLFAHDILQPDLVVVLNARQHIITPSRIQGTPDLVVEILSTSSEARDRKLKRARYQMAGVPEYWIVDPFEHKVEQLVLRDGAYVMLPATDVLQLTILEGVSVPLDEVWQADRQ